GRASGFWGVLQWAVLAGVVCLWLHRHCAGGRLPGGPLRSNLVGERERHLQPLGALALRGGDGELRAPLLRAAHRRAIRARRALPEAAGARVDRNALALVAVLQRARVRQLD